MGKKKGENYNKRGGIGLKNASFWAIISPLPSGGAGKKMNLKRGVGGGNDQDAQYIPLNVF